MKAVLFIFIMLQVVSFRETQLKAPRVKVAYEEKESVVKGYFKEKGLPYSGFEIFIRAFKKEKSLEVWVKEKAAEEFGLLHTYPFCASSGVLGPKRKEGDLQIPEGVYTIDRFNPKSDYHLALRVSYPNASDRVFADPLQPGGEIYIHGNCVTVGCIPLTDDKIKELYILCVEAKNNGQQEIPVHIFPDRLDLGVPEKLAGETKATGKVKAFWQNLQSVYLDFKTTRRLRKISITGSGEYVLAGT